MTMASLTRGSGRQPLVRALKLMATMVDSADDQWGVRDLARLTGMAPSTVHRLLATLQELNFVTLDAVTGRYSLGIEYLRLALKTASTLTIADAARPYLRSLSNSFDESAFLALYNARRHAMMFVAATESTHEVRYVVRLHTWMPIHVGASGLAILAFLPPAARAEALAAAHLPEQDLVRLERELEIIRGARYAITEGQRVPGAVGIAAPIFGATGAVVGDVGLSVPSQRIGLHHEQTLGEQVVACAARITHELSGLLQEDRAIAELDLPGSTSMSAELG
jgi:IclR family transcriptional regulator, acetate operon repressor